ncbi:hypothetical protein DM02DRAFT_640984 [Periconia macrospinosa]|uniref:Uncharacterized protein n=1 Tax=Periconia macrospinosa TaxID=97972 RepID=A0A2V1DZK8_9PLEO|nr:hypothetical protein DM02DRAFT_640984 [Periconia macrospinosa]
MQRALASPRWAPKPEDSEPKEPQASSPPTAQQPNSAPTEAPEPKVESQPPPPQPEVQPEPLPVDTGYAPQPYAEYSYPDDPSMDPFAQTASTDDLFFDDDFTPVAEPIVEQEPIEVPVPEPAPQEIPSAPVGNNSPHSQHAPRSHASGGDRAGRGGGRGRGARGRGRGRGGNYTDARITQDNGNNVRDKAQHDKKPVEADKPAATEPTETANTTASETPTGTPTPTTTSEQQPPSTPSGPKNADKPTPSVRGDRTLTGGTPRTRLTEEELTAKLALMQSKNKSREAAHAREQADAAKFEASQAIAAKQDKERRKQQAEKQKVERQNRQQMMGERERNRQRKLEAKGRAWDEEKEEGFVGTGEEKRRGAARGMHGAVAPSPKPSTGEETADLTTHDDDAGPAPRSHPGGRGRGGRGGRGGGGGRGGRDNHSTTNTNNKQQQQQTPPTAADFPDLPPSTSAAPSTTATAPKKIDLPLQTKTAAGDLKTEDGAAEKSPQPIKKTESFGLTPLSPSGAGRSWADQVENS